MTSPTAPPPLDRPPALRRSDRFFAWVAGLGIARSDGWIGGVAAGTAARLRIDPLIVRGVLVVATLCGLPLVLVYALAWALLPDAEGRVHLRELMRGRFEPAQLGILAGVAFGLLTSGPSLVSLVFGLVMTPYGAPLGVPGLSPFGALLFIIGLVLIGILLVLIVRAARRTPGTAPAHSAPTGDSGTAAAADARGEDAATDGRLPASPLALHPDDGDDFEIWRTQRADWQQQEQEWRRQQQDADRAARDQARRERQAAAAAFSADAAERRRIRRASNPRASAAYVGTVLGTALVAAAVVWLGATEPDATTVAVALFCAALVLAFGMIVAGVARRRSGFLAFAAVASLIAGLIFGGTASAGDVRLGDQTLMNTGGPSSVRQPFGRTDIHLANISGMNAQPVVLHKGVGYTDIYVNPGVELQLTATVGDVAVQWERTELDASGNVITVDQGTFQGAPRGDGRTLYRESVTSSLDPQWSGPDAPRSVISAPVTIDQDAGAILVVYSTHPDEEAAR